MNSKEYLANAWYVAAWSNQLGRELLSRTIIEKPVLLFRKQNGDPAAMSDMCAHRFAPLSMGKLCGDTVQCPYHGLRFGSDGKCVLNPHGDGKIPARMAVQSFPVAEKHKLIWIWMGDPAKADVSAIPDFSCHEASDMAFVGGMIEVQANYQLITDNLMDLTHGEYVHQGLLSTPALVESRLETIQRGTTVYANRWMPAGPIMPAHAMIFDDHAEGEMVDQWAYMRWDAPAHLLLDVGVTKQGASRSKGVWIYGTDILTPKDQFSTYYFWGITRNYKIDEPAAGQRWEQIINLAFEGQDKVMIEAQQKALGRRSIDELDPVLLLSDGGVQRARRVLASLIQEQSAPGPTNPSLALQRKVDSSGPVTPAL